MSRQHQYELRMTWTGNDGEGTRNYRAYRRDHVIQAAGKPDIPGSSDPAFRGDPQRYNPEELFVASLSSCHMLWYLHLCAVNGIVVTAYDDTPRGTMEEAEDGSGRFVEVELRPVVTISAGDKTKAEEFHHEAHAKCFIANSVNCTVRVMPKIVADSTQPA